MDGASTGFKELAAWQRAVELVEAVYAATTSWPADERFGLVAQVRRAVVSVPSNIAEGHARTGPREFLHHVSIAFGSLAEVETQLIIAERLGYLDHDASVMLGDGIVAARRPLSGLLRRLRRSAANPASPTPPPHRPSPSPPLNR